MNDIPTLEAFLQAPRNEVTLAFPPTIVYAQGGTRRDAVLHGVDSSSEGYPAWSEQRMIQTMTLLFSYGVQHIFTIAAAPTQFAEVGRYRERLTSWIAEGLASDAAIDRWRSLNWRVRIVGADQMPELQTAVEKLANAFPPGGKTIWWYVNAERGAHWNQLIALAKRENVTTQQDLIEAWFGEAVPPARLLLSFGKPIFDPDILPIPLLDQAQSYWSQRPGYSIDDRMVRQILYDYHYMRGTWRSDKRRRYETVHQHADIWRRGRVLGLGYRLGSFWYPQADQPSME